MKSPTTNATMCPTLSAITRRPSAYFGAIKPCLTEVGESRVDYVAAQTALAVKSALEKNWKVDFWNDSDAQNAAKNDMDDFFYDVIKRRAWH